MTTESSSSSSSSSSISPFICGISHLGEEYLRDACKSLRLARSDGYDYVVTALPDVYSAYEYGGCGGGGDGTTCGGTVAGGGGERWQRQRGTNVNVTSLESRWWCTSVIGTIVDPPRYSMDVVDGRDANDATTTSSSRCRRRHDGAGLFRAMTSSRVAPHVRGNARRSFRGMMEWAAHVNIPAVMLPPVPISSHDLDVDDDEDGDSGDVFPPTATVGADTPDAAADAAVEYARLVHEMSTSSICNSITRVQLWIRVPLTISNVNAYLRLLSRCEYSPCIGCIIHVTENDAHDRVDMPDIVRSLHLLVGGGHVRAICWDASVFLRNRGGYPTLSRTHQAIFGLVYGRLGRTLRTLIEGCDPTPSSSSTTHGGNDDNARPIHHLQYLRHLRARPSLSRRLDSEESILETPYLDNLQSPLQPLGDHLEYQTYETFERDPVKYERYGRAIYLALMDGMRMGRYPFLGSTGESSATSIDVADSYMDGRHDDDDDDEDECDDNDIDGKGGVVIDVHRVTILVVGAGRGPLVREAVSAVARASASLARPGRRGRGGGNRRRRALRANIVAIEKNPSAVLYLRGLKCIDPSWNGGRDYDPCADDGADGGGGGGSDIAVPGTSVVTVVGCDMREASSDPLLGRMKRDETRRADIVVSELLGSFGDNELSPECLDGVQRCGVLKENCVSIPQSYTAFIAPVSSARLHSEAKTQSCLPLNANEGPASPPVGMQRAMETPYVVRTHAASQTHDERPCWTYSHPHASSVGPSPSDDVDPTYPAVYDSGSARAADNIDNDRHAYISFQHDPTYGAANGCGYGPLDEDVSSILSSNQTEMSSSGDTTVTIHGFLGSFHSVLYDSPPSKSRGNDNATKTGAKDENRSSAISIAPNSFSVGMFSWFPLFFPLKQPLGVPPGATVNCNIWRRSDESRVWYEWCAEVVDNRNRGTRESCVLAASSIHNPGGRSYYVKK